MSERTITLTLREATTDMWCEGDVLVFWADGSYDIMDARSAFGAGRSFRWARLPDRSEIWPPNRRDIHGSHRFDHGNCSCGARQVDVEDGRRSKECPLHAA